MSFHKDCPISFESTCKKQYHSYISKYSVSFVSVEDIYIEKNPISFIIFKNQWKAVLGITCELARLSTGTDDRVEENFQLAPNGIITGVFFFCGFFLLEDFLFIVVKETCIELNLNFCKVLEKKILILVWMKTCLLKLFSFKTKKELPYIIAEK